MPLFWKRFFAQATLLPTLALLIGVPACSDDDTTDPCATVADQCTTAGGKSCDADVIQTCVEDANGCLVWEVTDHCPAGLACFGGACVCDDECAPGDSQCNGNTVQVCAESPEGCFYWADEVDCAALEKSCDDTEDATCVVGAGCGNDLLEPPELCDGNNLGEQTCESLSFGPGVLACGRTCRAFDTKDCAPPVTCGDAVIEAPEVCDGSELGGETCETQGFHGGELACRTNCGAFDTSGCDGFCGDGGLNGPEQCDMNDLGGATCESLGYSGGTLACDADCLLDTSGCTGICGDDVADGFEVCDGSDLAGFTCELFGYTGGTLACAATCDDLILTNCETPWAVTDCQVSDPTTAVTMAEYTLLMVRAQVWIPGLTDAWTGPDPDPLVWADVGVGADGSDPTQAPGTWDWFPAIPDAGFSHASADQYVGDLIVPEAAGSPYDFAYRFSADGGLSWVYCDRTGSTYTPADAGDLHVTP